MHRLQEIIRFLTAAGGTPSRDGNSTHFTYEDRGSIRMRTWTGPELIDDELVADGVRPGTSAPIVNRSHKRIFVVDKDHSIKCFTDPLGDGAQVEEDEIDDDAPWSENEIADVDTRVHSQSQLAVSYDKNTIFVFYQKPDGNLGCINEYNNQWKDVKLPAAAALAGTPLATCNTNYAVFLFYISTDGTVRYLENREGKWNDVFFSAAKIIHPKAELPGSAFKLTVAEDRQPFERIRPMVFCLDSNDLSIIRFRSKKLDTIGRVEGTEFVPSLGNKERNKYYFWSPYPFYTMIKRRGNTLAQVTRSKGLWTQYVKRSHPQQERGKSSAMEHLNRLQEPPIDNHNAPMTNNKTPATVGLETTNAQATILPQKSEQREISSGIPAQSTIFAGFGRLTDPLHAIKRRIFGTRQNEDATEEDALGNIGSNDANLALVLPETNEFEIVEVEGDAIESNEVEPSRFETEDVELRETESEEPTNDENDMNRTGTVQLLVGEDRPEQADSEDTAGESGSEGTDSGEVETTPSEVEEAEIEENQSKKAPAEEAQAEGYQSLKIQLEESQTEESGDEEYEDEEDEDEEFEHGKLEDEQFEHGKLEDERFEHGKLEDEEFEHGKLEDEKLEHGKLEDEKLEHGKLEDEKLEDEKLENKEIQTKEPQTREPRTEDHQAIEFENKDAENEKTQPGEFQERNIPSDEAPTENLQTDDAQENNTKPEGYEAKVSKSGSESMEQENVKWREPESKFTPDKAKVPATNTSPTRSIERPPEMKSSITEKNSQEADFEEPGVKYPNPKAFSTKGPTVDKGKGPATTDEPMSAESSFNTPQDIEKDLNDHIKKARLELFFPEHSDYIRIVSDNAFDLKNDKKNPLNRDADIQAIARLNLYQPVLYCDDSTSMNAGSRVEGQKERTRVNDQIDMVRRVTRLSTSVVPPGHGTSLQFINFVRDIHDNKLNLLQVEAIVNSVKPSGHTQIGTNLKEKILKPLVYDVIKNKKRLERPILVSCITDGCPSDEFPGRLKKEILKCTRFLKENGYPPSTIRFQISQIGNSSRADKFLKELKDDKELKEVLYCTAQRLDEQFNEFRHNEKLLEQWLLRTLLEPIMGKNFDSLNL